MKFVFAGVDPFVEAIVKQSNGGGGISSAIPETSTWIMMLLGFAGLGFAGYRKQKVVAVAA